MTRRSSSTTIRAVPGAPRPTNEPPALPPVGTSTARASMPASCALASVWPTAATCGSVKVTRGLSAPSLRSGDLAAEDAVGGDAALVLAHVGQQRAAVGVADDVEPVVAGDAQRVVDLDRPPGLDAERLDAEVGGQGAPADGDEQLVARRRSSRRRARP